MSGVRPGDIIAGKFQVERVLGEGGMGYVVAARHLQLGQIVALKFMRDEVCSPEFRNRFMREARNTVRLKSKHVSRVLDVGELPGGSPYMVMEYLEGTDLSELLHSRGPLPAGEASDYLIQACEAILEAHAQGIVHRDLKPANLFLTKGSSGEPIVKVLDFGVSKVLDLGIDEDTNPGGRPRPGRQDDSVVTKATDLLGSPSYMAPEQIVSARDADAASDVWSLGVILFRLVSGKAPFAGNSLGELIQTLMHGPIPSLRDARPDIPEGLELVVMRCLDRDRERRPDVGELARMLAPYAGPTASPSLERIAILGPALVTGPPAAPVPTPRSNSNRSANGTWTRPPIETFTNESQVSAARSRGDLTTTSAIVWGAVFVIVLGVCVIAVATLTRKPAPLVDVRAASTSAPPQPEPVTPVSVPADTTATAPAMPVTALASAVPQPAASARPAPHGAVAHGKGKATAPSTPGKPPAGGDIPTTRE